MAGNSTKRRGRLMLRAALPVLIGLAAVAYAVWCFMGLRNTEGKQRAVDRLLALAQTV